MFRKFISILLFLVILCGCIFLFFRLKENEVPVSAAIKAIPIDASFIFESHKTLSLWKNISETSNIWKALLEIPYFSELNRQVSSLDSIVDDNAGMSDILSGEPLFISAHTNGMNRFNFLFICPLPGASGDNLSTYLESLKGNISVNDLHYEGVTIHCIKVDETNSFYYAISGGIFIGSFGPALIEESLRQLESGISLMNNTYFTKVLNASGEHTPANIFINFQAFANVGSHLFNKYFLPMLSSMQDFGEWMGLDLTMSPEELIMSGFTDCDTTGNQFLSLFQRQAQGEIKTASVVPASTAYMVCHEFSDYSAFRREYAQYWDSYNKNRNRTEWLDRIQERYGMDIEKYFYPWIHNEVAEIITEPSDSTLQNDTYVLAEANDINEAVNKLSAFADTVAARKSIQLTDSVYLHHEIRNLDLDNVTANILGNTFEGVTKSWFTSISNYIVFANSFNALKNFIYEYEAGNTLDKDSYYKDFIKQHVENESNIYIYNNIALSSRIYEKYLDEACAAGMKKYRDVFSKFHAASVQFSFMQGMFYTNFYLKRNPAFRKKPVPLWQATLDTTLAISPCWVTDYSTREQCVMAEDKNENVYLLNSNGTIEWKNKIDGIVQSPVFEVDALKNHKIQYLFNTAGSIILFDRKGNELNGFPVKLKFPASGPLNVLDYDNKRNYRLLLPCSDLKIREYDIKGKPIRGWAMPETQSPVKCPVCYCEVDNKDYLIVIDEAGKVYVFDRKGNERLNLDNRMPPNLRNFYIMQGKALPDTYIMACDTAGTIFRLSLSGELSTIQYLKGNYPHPDFVPAPADSAGKQEMIFLSGSDVWAYNADKTERFHTTAKGELENNILLFMYPDHSLRIGAVDGKDGRIYLWDNAGNLCPGFPLHGSESFSIADMKNDGSLYLVTGAYNKVYVYGLQ